MIADVHDVSSEQMREMDSRAVHNLSLVLFASALIMNSPGFDFMYFYSALVLIR